MAGFILAVILAVWGLDYLGIGERFYNKRRFKGVAHQLDCGNSASSVGCDRLSN